MITHIFNDGGRKAAGYKGFAGDCVPRAIAIATGKSYQSVYDELTECNKNHAENRNDLIAKSLRHRKQKGRGFSPRNGVYNKIIKSYLLSLGWKWVPTMFIGQGTKVHLREDELPKGNLIVNVSKHTTAVIDGVLHDTHDCSRDGTRAVYGYYTKEYHNV